MTTPRLHDLLEEIAGDVRPVDLSARVTRTARRLRRRRALIAGTVAIVVVASGSAAWSRAHEAVARQSAGSSGTVEAHPQPCSVFDDFTSGDTVAVTAEMKAHATAMGTALCAWVGGGKTYSMEEWVSDGGLNGAFSGLTYNIQAHVTGAAAGPVDDEAWVAVYKGAPGTGPFHDGTQIELQTKLAQSLEQTIEAPGSPFDVFSGP